MEHRAEWLKPAPADGFLAQADRLWIAQGKAECITRLNELEDHFEPSGILPLDIALTKSCDKAKELADRALARWPGAPEKIVAQFRTSWFGYLQSAFLEERATNRRVRVSFDSLLDELRFDRFNRGGRRNSDRRPHGGE